MDYKTCKEIMIGVNSSVIDETIISICAALVGKGLSFRQAEVLIDLAKERLKDAKI